MRIEASLDEVKALFQIEATDPKEFCRRFGRGLLDAVHLYTINTPTESAPDSKITVTWRAYDGQVPKVIMRRDACLLECHDSFELHGQRGWVRSHKSIEMTCCPPFDMSFGFVRSTNHGSGHVFVESREYPGFIDMYYIVHLDCHQGNRAEWVLEHVFKCRQPILELVAKKRCRALLDIEQFLTDDRYKRTLITEKSKYEVQRTLELLRTNDRFNCPKLSLEEEDAFRETALQHACDLISKTELTEGTVKYTKIADQLDLKLYKGASRRGLLYLGHMQVVATISEIQRLFAFHTSNPQEFNRRFGKDLLDTVPLYSIPSSGNQSIMINWSCYDMPKMLSRWDANTLECKDTFEMNDRQGWIWSSKSIELPCCPPFDATVGLMRLLNYGSGFVFLEADRPGQLDMFYVAHWECGQLMKQFDDMLMQQCRMLLNVDRFLREIRLSLLPSVPPVDSTPSTRTCQLCTKKFLPFSKRSHCDKCGQICCHRCIQLWRLPKQASFEIIAACFDCSINRSALVAARRSLVHSSTISSPASLNGDTGGDVTEWRHGR
ncbi:hypothetical protein AC1031_016256 [Aphanomyces cochlioides]|nr:hypothetical protein AC1031_016256 [Aphanomyces cochlioides]